MHTKSIRIFFLDPNFYFTISNKIKPNSAAKRYMHPGILSPQSRNNFQHSKFTQHNRSQTEKLSSVVREAGASLDIMKPLKAIAHHGSMLPRGLRKSL